MTAAPPRTTATTTGAGVSRALLAIEFLSGTAHLASSFSAHRALPQISLIHHHCIVQQLLADGRRQLSRINVVGANLLPRNVVDGKIHLAPAFFLAAVAGAVPTLRSIFVCRTVT